MRKDEPPIRLWGSVRKDRSEQIDHEGKKNYNAHM